MQGTLVEPRESLQVHRKTLAEREAPIIPFILDFKLIFYI
jgi:hypothetical protein